MNVSGSKFLSKAAAVYLLVTNVPPAPNTKQDVISKYFCSLEKNLDTKNKSVLLIGDSMFSAPNFDWEGGLPLPNCYFYSKSRVLQITPQRASRVLRSA
jgi:hypothetical protein